MENTLLIQLTNQKAAGIIRELEELKLIKVLKKNIKPSKVKLSQKYKGAMQKQPLDIVNDQLNELRSSWE